jgi:starch phosphorylase
LSEPKEAAADRLTSPAMEADLLEQYGCGPIRFSGNRDALYERHLLFDDVIDPVNAGARDRFEAVARSVRDVLSQRWVQTERVYDREDPKRIYYLSMEFLIGRSLGNNVINLLLDRLVQRAAQQRDLDWIGLLEQEPDAGLGNGGLGRLAACFLDSMATMQLPAMGYGLRYEYGMFNNPSKTAGSAKVRTTGCAAKTRGRSRVPMRRSRSSSAAHSRCTAEGCWPSRADPLP